jgi:CIC family chloride channel protein
MRLHNNAAGYPENADHDFCTISSWWIVRIFLGPGSFGRSLLNSRRNVPELVGGGDQITQRALIDFEGPANVGFALLIGFALGAVSYTAGTPGGLFAPSLVLGAQSGPLFGAACRFIFPALAIEPQAFALVGMAAFLTGVVRAPVTGIVL